MKGCNIPRFYYIFVPGIHKIANPAADCDPDSKFMNDRTATTMQTVQQSREPLQPFRQGVPLR